MHAVLLPDLAALPRVGDLVGRLAVHGEQRPDDDVSVHLRQPIDGRGVARVATDHHQQPQPGPRRRCHSPGFPRPHRVTVDGTLAGPFARKSPARGGVRTLPGSSARASYRRSYGRLRCA
ncbi:hypothetical protein NP493_77g01014 [Ridgeia piscesae]|uniref:Uncharacterized protein n=1 Tax=Ridgeia piscesae TaxID=27915 RepID=A0AAD9P997_RIDPI|nr:hypothetical protein NP493_77g01014 [Ridgeia piscesae]